MNYNPSTIARIGDLNRGLLAQTPVSLAATYLLVASNPMFNVYGRIRILAFDIEVVADLSADATTLQFYFDPSVPAGSEVTMSAASGALTSLAVGQRVAMSGTALTTAPIESVNPAISLAVNAYIDVGAYNGVGVLGVIGAAAAQTGTTATFRVNLLYVPIYPGSYVSSAI